MGHIFHISLLRVALDTQFIIGQSEMNSRPIKEGRKEGRKEIFIWQSIHKLVVFTNTIISSLEDHTKTAMRSLS